MKSYYTLYVDESGTASLTDHTASDFILSGIAVDANDDRELSGYFNFIKRKYGIPEDVHFHSFDLFGNRGHEFYLTDKQAMELAHSLSEFLEISPFTIFLDYFNKKDLRDFLGIKDDDYFKGSKDRKRDKDIGYEVLASDIFLSFGKFLRAKDNATKNSIGKIVAESRQNSDYVLLKTYLDCKVKDRYETKNLTKNSTSFDKHVTSITFEDKKGLSCGLQIADLVSYIGNLKIQRKITANEDRGIQILWDTLRSKLENNDVKKISGEPFKHLLSTARVHKITEYNKR